MGKYYGYQIDSSDLENIREICVLCWGLLGDVLLRVPVIEALKQRFPQARITAVVDPVGSIALQNHPDISERVIFSRKKKPLSGYLVTFIKSTLYLRSRKFDLCVNLYSGGSSPLVTRLMAARISLGFDHTPALRRANNLLVKCPEFCGHWTKALGKKLEPLGVKTDQIRRGSSFYCSDEAVAYAKKTLPDPATDYVAINLGAGVEAKRWSVENFVRLANEIHADYGVKIIVLTNPGMEQLSDEFKTLAGNGDYMVLPVISLDRVAAILKRCRAVITGDTSIMHLAFGVKCPSLVLFTQTRPEHVEPEDCMHVACFVENEDSLDQCGLAYGTADIPIEYALQRFDTLYEQLD